MLALANAPRHPVPRKEKEAPQAVSVVHLVAYHTLSPRQLSMYSLCFLHRSSSGRALPQAGKTTAEVGDLCLPTRETLEILQREP